MSKNIHNIVMNGFGNAQGLEVGHPTTIALVTLRGFIPKVEAVAAVPSRVRIGAHGLLHGGGSTPIGRGL